MPLAFGLIAGGALMAYAGLKGKTLLEAIKGLPGSKSSHVYTADVRAAEGAALRASLGGTGTANKKNGGNTPQQPTGNDPVSKMKQGADEIDNKPYKWGGGHGGWQDSGYDCSGAWSYILHKAGLLKSPLTSGGFMSWGEPGPGKRVTIYANPVHVWGIIDGKPFATGVLGKKNAEGSGGPHWGNHSSKAGFVARHPKGL